MGAAPVSPDLLPALGDGRAGMPLGAAELALPLVAPGAVLERGWLAKGDWYMLEWFPPGPPAPAQAQHAA